jgi:hypothetical protein
MEGLGVTLGTANDFARRDGFVFSSVLYLRLAARADLALPSMAALNC